MEFSKQISKLLAKLILPSLATSSVGCVQVSAMEQSARYSYESQKKLLNNLWRLIILEGTSPHILPDDIKQVLRTSIENRVNDSPGMQLFERLQLLWLFRQTVYFVNYFNDYVTSKPSKLLNDHDFRRSLSMGSAETYDDDNTDNLREPIIECDRLIQKYKTELTKLITFSEVNEENRLELLKLLNYCIINAYEEVDPIEAFDEYFSVGGSTPLRSITDFTSKGIMTPKDLIKMEDYCQLCLEYLENVFYNDRRSVVALGCNHLLHGDCYDALVREWDSPYRCPTCKKKIEPGSVRVIVSPTGYKISDRRSVSLNKKK